MTTVVVAATRKIRKLGVPDAALRWTERRLAPGPMIVRFLLRSSSSLVRVIAERRASNTIVPPAAAFTIAWRKVQVGPGQDPPESALLLTVVVAAPAETA